MGKHPPVKERHEEGACRRFLAVYNAQQNAAYTFLRLQPPPAPDCLCDNGLNIEIVTAYYDKEAAKILNQLAEGKTKPPTSVIEANDADKKGEDAVDNCITKKATRTYEWRGLLWLVIDAIAPLTEWEQFEKDYLAKQRGLPSGNFDEVWVLMKDFDGDHIAQVTL